MLFRRTNWQTVDITKYLFPGLVVTTELLSGFKTAGVSHSSADHSLGRNPVCPFSSPFSGGSEEEEDDELENCRDLREDGLYGQEEEHEDVDKARGGQTRAPPKCRSAEQV